MLIKRKMPLNKTLFQCEVTHIVKVSAFSLSWSDWKNYAVLNCETLDVSWGANHLNSHFLCHNRITRLQLLKSSFDHSVILFNCESRTFGQETWPGCKIHLCHVFSSHSDEKAIVQCHAAFASVSLCVCCSYSASKYVS